MIKKTAKPAEGITAIGRGGETSIKKIAFDVARFLEVFGASGIFTLLIKLDGNAEEQHIELNLDGNEASFVVAQPLTASLGSSGKAQIRYDLPDGTVAKTDIFPVAILASLSTF